MVGRTNVRRSGARPGALPSYTGDMEIEVLGTNMWRAKLHTSGRLTFSADTLIDVFLVGGGSSGGMGGGAGGFTKTYKRFNVGHKDGDAILAPRNAPIDVIVGQGGIPTIVANIPTSASGDFSQILSSDFRANGGNQTPSAIGASGGSGGGGASDGVFGRSAGWGGSNGSEGSAGLTGIGLNGGGLGQGHTTREFGEAGEVLYSGGGGGGGINFGVGSPGGEGGGGLGGGPGLIPHAGMDGFGGGGGGTVAAGQLPGRGGNGIVIIRWGAGWEDASLLSQMEVAENLAVTNKNLE